MNNAPVEICLRDADGRYLRINRRYEELWGVTDEGVRSKLPGDVHRQKDFAEATRSHDLAMLQGEWTLEKEDDVFLENGVHTLHMIKFPVRDAAGKVSGPGAIATDATQRKRAEARRTISLCQDGRKRAR